MAKTKERKLKKNVYQNAVQLVLVGGLTGVLAGAAVTLYNLLAKYGETFSQDIYAVVRENPLFLPLLFAVLILGAFFLTVAVYFVPMVRGSGIPQVEGATRGSLCFRWWRDGAVMFAASLVSIVLGLSAGAEGPSLFIGSACGDGVATLLKRNEMVRRYQVTGGACAGLAVAFNAPLTGMAFAFEEAHKRFTPEVFICAFSSVIFAVLTRNGLYSLFSLSVTSAFHGYAFPAQGASLLFYAFLLISSIVCGLAGVLLYQWIFFLRKAFEKIRAKTAFIGVFLRILIAVLLGGALSLVTAYVMGGGHSLIESLGTLGGSVDAEFTGMFSLPVVVSLAIVCLLKFAITGVNVGAGVPCGAFIPMLAIGACIGALLNCAWLALGMDASYADLIVVICMSAFFTSIVKAPITGIVMALELTWSFTPLLPVVIGVSVGYFIGDVARTEGVYEKLLKEYLEETGSGQRQEHFEITVRVGNLCIADGRALRDILFPTGARVALIERADKRIFPSGETVVRSGDILHVDCVTSDEAKMRDELENLVADEP